MNKPWVSVEQITGHLGVTRDSTYRWIHSQRLPAHRGEHLCKFNAFEVDAWVRAGGAEDNAEGKNP